MSRARENAVRPERLRTPANRLRLLVTVARPPVLMLFALYTALALAGAGRAGDHLLLGRALVPVAAFLMFSVAVNDLADERIDRVNLPGDPRRPLVGAGALRAEMTVVALASAAVAVAGGFLLGPWPGLAVIAGLLVSAGYSLPPVRLSDRGAVAALVLPACYVAVPYLVGWLAVAPLPRGRGMLLPLGLYVGFVGRILLKDFRDVRGDALFGKRTFLVRHGRVWTCRFSAVGWTAGCALLLAGAPRPTPALVTASAVQLAVVLWLLRRLAADAHPRREALLISATAIVGRGMLLTLLAHESMLPQAWSPLARSAVLVALLVLTLGQVRVMLRHGPKPRLSLPVEGPAADLRAQPSGV
ncbi:UbiA family prenyltransferase [Streptomyces sp. NBC_01198]|uniref:UbiA family prenyltransferase n=1 Tax=Streptomyces sp. NBC_01198 TaxID=2903769 RepID=UPI002E10A762|nr:UbiA family prenyltransferase [Streptomyces sp. NBC_01198]